MRVYLGCALLCFMMLFFRPAPYSPTGTIDIVKPELRLRGRNREENLVSRFDSVLFYDFFAFPSISNIRPVI